MADPGSNFVKYFAHGLAFAILFLIVGLVWVVLFVLLVICGLWLGLILALVLFFVLMGYVNAFITESLWFPVRTGFLACLGHGFLLFLALLPVNGVVLAIHYLVTPDFLVSFLIFLVTAPVAGFLAKSVGGLWRVYPQDVLPFGTWPPGPPPEEAPPSPLDLPRK